MSQIKVRINGRGNAWPIILGQDHPFYDRSKYEDLANASCSIIKSSINDPKEKDIIWDLMIDAGHGAVQYLIQKCNRIPEALFLTHPHIDHTLGLDWIIQSYYKIYKKAYPVYATILCWEKVKMTFPQLSEMVNFKELIPYQKKIIEEVEDVQVTAYPVYHGKSASGAAMFLFNVTENQIQRRILFTGDILCPLLRDEDYSSLMNVDLLVTDANNRFPYPGSNHWSILNSKNNEITKFLDDFIAESTIALFLFPHFNHQVTDNYGRCFDYFLNREVDIKKFPFSLKSFMESVEPKQIALIHYSGGEDERYYDDK
ncbi:MBL fold metallo-hydrolase, partial [Bacteroidota bacterium]